MSRRSSGLLVAGAALALAGCHRAAPDPAAARVAAGGVALASASISLPDEAERLPAGPGVDAVTANCTGCHSASMITSQPRLTAEQWQAELTKMREAYHAPVSPGDDPALLAYLTRLSAAKGGQ